MSRIILRATEENRGMKGPGDWKASEWVVRNDRTFSLKASYIPADNPVPDKIIHGILSPSDYDSLVQFINSVWSSEETDAYDGTAWEFRSYGFRGALEKHRLRGYIYGIEPFESIAGILMKQLKDDDI